MNIGSAVTVVLAAALGLCGCGSGGKSSSERADCASESDSCGLPSVGPFGSGDAVAASRDAVSALNAIAKAVMVPGDLVDPNAPASISIPADIPGGISFSNCISADSGTTGNRVEVVRTFDCPRLKGRLSAWRDTVAANVGVTTDLVFTGDALSVQLHSKVDASFSAGGVAEVEATSVTVIASDGNTLRISASRLVRFSPDNSGQPSLGGALEYSGQLNVIRNGADLGSQAVISKDLHVSACGLDAGTIEIKGPDKDYVLVVTGCGQNQVYAGGVPISSSP